MRYWVLGVGGIVALAASIAASATGLYGLLLIGTCASGGPYEIAQPCPDGTGLRVLLLVGGIFAGLASLVVFALRGGDRAPSSVGVATWVLGFGSLAAAFLYAGFGPEAGDEDGWGLFSGLMGGFFVLMAVPPLFFVRRASSRAGTGASIAGLGALTPAAAAPRPSGGSLADDLRQLGELRAKGVLTDEEFARAKDRLLAGS